MKRLWLVVLVVVASCFAPLTPIAAQTARDSAHTAVAKVATDTLAKVVAPLLAQLCATKNAPGYMRSTACPQFKRQLARIQAADSVLLIRPNIVGLTCDSLAKVVAFNGAVGTTPEIQQAFATCKK